MINWNITDARQVEKLSDIASGEDEQTIVRAASVPSADEKNSVNENPSDDEKRLRAIALLVAIGLTAALAVWRNPESFLWLFLASLVLSSWCCALGPFISEILRVAIAWLVEAFGYLRGLFASWRDGARGFVDRWVWSRFRPSAIHTRGVDHAKVT